MNEFDFTLVYDISNIIKPLNEIAEILYMSGCEDAIIGIGRAGQVAINFTRESSNALEAVTSAQNNVTSVLPQAKLIEATPDIVGLTDIAEILKCSRQNIRKIYQRYKETTIFFADLGRPDNCGLLRFINIYFMLGACFFVYIPEFFGIVTN